LKRVIFKSRVEGGASHEVVQVLANPFESQRDESGKDRARRRRRTSAFLVRVRSRGSEIKGKVIQRPVNVERAVSIASGERYPEHKVKGDEVSGRQK
jgi:hypothetical protein